MSLDKYSQVDREGVLQKEAGVLELFKNSALFELQQSAYGLAQTVGLQDKVGKMAEPDEAQSWLGQNAQLLGRGVASFLPTLGVALATRFGLGKVLGDRVGEGVRAGGGAAQTVMLKRSAIGLSVLESGTTGLIAGAVLKPTDDKVAKDWGSFTIDRATAGVTGALSFGTLNLTSLGLNRLAGAKALSSIGAETVLKSAPLNGLISGAVGGLANVELGSLVDDGKFTADGARISKSMYEMAVVGGLFGLTTTGITRLGSWKSATMFGDRFDVESADTVRVNSISKLNRRFGEGSTIMKRLLAFEADGSDIELRSLSDFIEKAPKTRVPLLEKMIAEDASADKFNSGYMSGRLLMTSHFGADSPVLNRLLELSPEHMSSLGYFVKDDPVAGVPLIERFVNDGATEQQLSSRRLRSIANLERLFERDSPVMRRLFELEKQELRLSDVSDFATENPRVNAPRVKEMLERGFTAGQLNMSNLLDRSYLSRLAIHFEPDGEVMKYVDRLQTQGLSAERVAQYVDEYPDSRRSLVEQLVRQNADVRRFNNQMSLIGFPDQVAFQLAEAADNGGMPVARLLGNLRDWQAGRHFRELVINQVESGSSIDASALETVMVQAKNTPAGSRENESVQVASSKPSSKESAEMASILMDVANSIEAAIPKERPIVLLGRDMSPILPLLRARGREAQYFLWSSIQSSGPETVKQWRKEVPPNAAVIDTGYRGTILNSIRMSDQGASGYMLSKIPLCEFPQLLVNSDHSSMVNKIEMLPKLISRVTTYTEHGGAVSRRQRRDSETDVGTKRGSGRWFVEGAMREIFREAGLPAWDVWRYSQYIGLTPGERLGLNTKAGVEKHYRRVERLRLLGVNSF